MSNPELAFVRVPARRAARVAIAAALWLGAGAAAALATGRPASPAPGLGEVGLPRQVSEVYWLKDFSPVEGSQGVIKRRWNHVGFTMSVTGLRPGDATTLWFCGWNDPTVCVDGPGTCGSHPADLEFDVPGAFCVWGAGAVVDCTGRAAYAGKSWVGRPPADVLFGELTDPARAEINLVVKTHGPALAGLVDRQITSYDAACDVQHCEELQVAIFPAP